MKSSSTKVAAFFYFLFYRPASFVKLIKIKQRLIFHVILIPINFLNIVLDPREQKDILFVENMRDKESYISWSDY